MKDLLRALRLLLVLSVLLGVIYPVLVTAVGGAIFPHQVGGSLITKDGQVIGSRLIAQKFEAPKYFHPRPSAIDYKPLPSGGSNQGPTSKALRDSVAGLKSTLGASAPNDALYASGSGLDPEISPANAQFQIARVVQARALTPEKTEELKTLVQSHVRGRDLGFLGEETVNVLELNLALDRM